MYRQCLNSTIYKFLHFLITTYAHKIGQDRYLQSSLSSSTRSFFAEILEQCSMSHVSIIVFPLNYFEYKSNGIVLAFIC
jgi:hypothetical protein